MSQVPAGNAQSAQQVPQQIDMDRVKSYVFQLESLVRDKDGNSSSFSSTTLCQFLKLTCVTLYY